MNNQLLGAVIALIVALVPVARSFISAKFGSQKLHSVAVLASLAVSAAERAAATNSTGLDKYSFASKYLVDAAKHVGVRLTADEVTGFIHSALADYEAAKGVIKTPAVPATA